MTASTNRLAAGRHQLPGLPNRQRGIALMILLLVVTLGSAAVVLGELNSRVHTTADIGNTIATARVLKEAKEALLGAAVSDVAPLGLPQRPGQLPWPDRSTDGNYDGRSDCVTNNFVIDHLIGRFPYFGEGQCFFGGRSSVLSLDTMYRDGSGQPLWYAVSRNLVNAGSPQLSVNPDLVDNPAYEWMRVCDSRGRLVSDRVAAVIIAPGPPLGTQDRSLQTPRDRLRQQYLERVQVTDAGGRTSWLSNYDYNANADDGEMDGPGECRERDNLGNSPTGEEFVIPIGRDPALQNTFNDQLVYITADELIEGVQQRAINVVVQALEAYRDEVVTSGGAARGRFPWMSPFANAWEGKQVYDADPDTLLFEGQVSGGSATTLVDSTRTFDVSLIGAALRNLTTGASTVVTGIAATGEIEFGQLLGGMDANSGSSPKGEFSAGDQYEIATFRGDAIGFTREGQLPFHHPDVPEDRATDFTVAWSSTVPGVVVPPTLGTPVQPASIAPGYNISLINSHSGSDLTGPVRVEQGGVCRYEHSSASGIALVRCQGRHVRSPILQASVLSWSANVLEVEKFIDVAESASLSFFQWAVGRGDRIRNLTDVSQGVIKTASTSSHILEVYGLTGGTSNSFAANDAVAFDIASQSFTGTATGGGVTTIEDTARPDDFVSLGIAVNDIVVNQTDGSVAFVTAVTGTELTVGAFFGGADNLAEVGDIYEVRSDFVDRREYQFDLYYTGNEVKQESSTAALYAVSSGSPTQASPFVGLPRPAADAIADGVPMEYVEHSITLEEYADSDLVSRRTIDFVDGSEGYLSTASIERDFVVGDEIPDWFHDNGWHEFVYVAISDGFSPAGTGSCLGGRCLNVFQRRPGRDTAATAHINYVNKVQAVVIGAGVAVKSTESRPAGQRRDQGNGVFGSPDVADYFEEENAQLRAPHVQLGGLGDDEFEATPKDIPLTPFSNESLFNDRVVSICEGSCDTN